MQLFNLHRKSVYVLYKNRLCSFSTLIIALLILLSLALPYCVISFVNPEGTAWERFRLVYEQPQVHFNYEYFFLAEVDRSPDDSVNQLITCSSFDSFNRLLADQNQECNAIKVTTDDGNMDGKIDKLSASVAFNVPDDAVGLAFYTFYFFLEAEVKSNCHFSIPALVSFSKQAAPTQPFASGVIAHRGHLRANQFAALQCPFFMRAIKTHFNPNFHPSENYSTVEEFLPESIVQQIESTNAAYFTFEPIRTTQWRHDGSGDVEIKVELLIGGEDSQKTALLYNASLWQKVAQFWTQYFSLLIVVLWIMEWVKDWLFGSCWLRAMELEPWKKKVS